MFNNTWYRKEKPTLSYPGYGGGVAGFAFMAAGGDYPGTGEWFGTRGLSGGGNQMRQPFFKSKSEVAYEEYPNIEHIHNFSWYIGNYPSLEREKIDNLIGLLNETK